MVYRYVVRIVLHGSRKPSLQDEAVAILGICVKGTCCRMQQEPKLITREENKVADYRSRLLDTNDWMLNPLVFSLVIACWGPFTIDRLADAQNAQIPNLIHGTGALVLKW